MANEPIVAIPSWQRLDHEATPACSGVDRIANKFEIYIPYGFGALITFPLWRDAQDRVKILVEGVEQHVYSITDCPPIRFDNTLAPFHLRFIFEHDANEGHHRHPPRFCPSKCRSEIDHLHNKLNIRSKRELRDNEPVSTQIQVEFFILRRDGTLGEAYRLPD